MAIAIKAGFVKSTGRVLRVAASRVVTAIQKKLMCCCEQNHRLGRLHRGLNKLSKFLEQCQRCHMNFKTHTTKTLSGYRPKVVDYGKDLGNFKLVVPRPPEERRRDLPHTL